MSAKLTMEQLLAQYAGAGSQVSSKGATQSVVEQLDNQLPMEFKSTNHMRAKRPPNASRPPPKSQNNDYNTKKPRYSKPGVYQTSDGREAYYLDSFVQYPWSS
jgi:hypothetical protein